MPFHRHKSPTKEQKEALIGAMEEMLERSYAGLAKAEANIARIEAEQGPQEERNPKLRHLMEVSGRDRYGSSDKYGLREKYGSKTESAPQKEQKEQSSKEGDGLKEERDEQEERFRAWKNEEKDGEGKKGHWWR